MTDEESFLESADGTDPVELIDAVDGEVSSDELIDRGDDTEDGVVTDAPAGIEEIIRERDEYLDALRRLQADFENFRKRTIRQQSEQLDRASLSLIEHLLPVLDALDLALAHGMGQSGEVKEGDLYEALVQIGGLPRATLEKEGLERIDATGATFDPTVHDAVSRVDDDDVSSHEPTVVDVMRAGYRLKGKVIRPAMVAVKG